MYHSLARMQFSAITLSLVISHVSCHSIGKVKLPVTSVTTPVPSDPDKGEICHEAGVKLEHYLSPTSEIWCREICLKKPVSECNSHPLAKLFCFCRTTPLKPEPQITTKEFIIDKLCEVTTPKAEYFSPISDWYCTNQCGLRNLPAYIAASLCAKDPVARFVCLCDGVALGPSVALPEHLPNSDKICTNPVPRSEFYRYAKLTF